MRLAGLIGAALALGLATQAGPGRAQSPPVVLQPGEVLLKVEAHGVASHRPDVMTVTAGVVTTGDSAGAALEANSALAERMIEAVRRHGVEPRDIQTTRLEVEPHFAEVSEEAEEQAERAGRKPTILGYVARNMLELRVRDLAKGSQLIDALFRSGANSVTGPEFSLADPAPAEREARRAAIAEARLEAETYAEALNMRVARVLQVSERGDFGSSGEYIVVTGSRRARSDIEPGEIDTRIEIWIDYALLPR